MQDAEHRNAISLAPDSQSPIEGNMKVLIADDDLVSRRVLEVFVALTFTGVQPVELSILKEGTATLVMQICFENVVVPHGLVADNVTVKLPAVA